MRVCRYGTADEFLAATFRFRAGQPLLANTLSTLALARAGGSAAATDGDHWLGVVDDAGEVVGAASCLPPRGLLVAPMPAGAAAALAGYAAREIPGLPAVDGPLPTSEMVVRRYGRLTGATVAPGLDLRLLATSAVRVPAGVPGTRRDGVLGDRDLLTRWVGEFTAEAVPHQPAPPADHIERRLAGRPPTWFSLWEVGGEPVSFCWATAPTEGIVRIAAVYTPLEHRGHGYAGVNVATVSSLALDRGASACMLYTDRTNTTSNRVYERIGYAFVTDAMEWLVSR